MRKAALFLTVAALVFGGCADAGNPASNGTEDTLPAVSAEETAVMPHDDAESEGGLTAVSPMETDITELVEKDKGYNFSVRCRMPKGQRAIPFKLSLRMTSPGGETTDIGLLGGGTQKMVSETRWIQLEGSYVFTGDFIKVLFCAEAANGEETEFYSDGVTVTEENDIPHVQDIPGIKDVYAGCFKIGVAGGTEDFERQISAQFMERHFNVITGGNLMKPDALQPARGDFRFDIADKFVNYAAQHGMTVIGHTLAWHNQSPRWMNGGGVTREEAVENLTGHIKTVVTHFKGKVTAWDVVNEAFADGVSFNGNWKDSLRKSPWYNTIGEDYLEIAFGAAREADPDARLIYNDYNLDYTEKAKAVAAMVRDFKERGVPIDGVGMQSHYSVSTNPANVEKSIRLFTDEGVTVSVTELDVTVPAKGQTELTDEQEKAQAVIYAELFTVYKRYSEFIDRVTFWGFTDRTSWRASQFPLAFDANYRAKPAYYGIINPDG